MKKQILNVFLTAIFGLIISSGLCVMAQSTDENHPTPITSSVLSGTVRGSGTHVYSLKSKRGKTLSVRVDLTLVGDGSQAFSLDFRGKPGVDGGQTQCCDGESYMPLSADSTIKTSFKVTTDDSFLMWFNFSVGNSPLPYKITFDGLELDSKPVDNSDDNCKTIPLKFKTNNETLILNGNTKRCNSYSFMIPEESRLQVKLTSATGNVFFQMNPQDRTGQEGDDFCEECKSLDEYFEKSDKWSLWVEKDDSGKFEHFRLTLTLSKSQIISGGVLNGKATSLPKPPYPKNLSQDGKSVFTMRGTKLKTIKEPVAVGENESVTVKVIVDETGKVIFAGAIAGNEAFYESAESAAKAARFPPTLQNGKPVQVSGNLVYNFKRP
jgi:hypothetical protein